MFIPVILDSLRRSVGGDSWHGSSLLQLLADVEADEAVSNPVTGGHSIAEIVVHIAAWMDEVASWLEGNRRSMTDERDWPPPPAWPQPLDRLQSAHLRLQRALDAFPPSRLAEPIGKERDPAAGSGLSFATTLVGVAEHNAYHGGQIALLRRAWRERR